MSSFLQLSRQADAQALPAGKWTALRFDKQDFPEGTERGNWRIIAGDDQYPVEIAGDVTTPLSMPVTKLELQAVAMSQGKVRPLSPTVAFSSLPPVVEHQMVIHARIEPGEKLVILARPSDETGTAAVFSGFVTER